MTGVGDDSRGRLLGRPWLVVGFVLAIGATLALVLSDDLRYLRLGIVAALWAALIGAFLAVKYRKHAAQSEDAVAEAQAVYELELEREIAARREYELEMEAEKNSAADSRGREELEALRAEVSALRDSLQSLFGGEVLLERVALTAQATRMRKLSDENRMVTDGVPKKKPAQLMAGKKPVETGDRPTELIDRVLDERRRKATNGKPANGKGLGKGPKGFGAKPAPKAPANVSAQSTQQISRPKPLSERRPPVPPVDPALNAAQRELKAAELRAEAARRQAESQPMRLPKPDEVAKSERRPESAEPTRQVPRPEPKTEIRRPAPVEPKTEIRRPEPPPARRAEMSRPAIRPAEVSRPDIPRVEMSRPDIPRVEMSRPDIPRVEMSRPDIPRVEMSRPDIPRVEMSRPDIPRVEMSRPDLPRVGGKPNGGRPEPRKAPEPPRQAPGRPAASVPPPKPSEMSRSDIRPVKDLSAAFQNRDDFAERQRPNRPKPPEPAKPPMPRDAAASRRDLPVVPATVPVPSSPSPRQPSRTDLPPVPPTTPVPAADGRPASRLEQFSRADMSPILDEPPSRHSGSHRAPAEEAPPVNPTLPESVRNFQGRSGGRRRKPDDSQQLPAVPAPEPSGGGRRRRPDGEPPAWEGMVAERASMSRRNMTPVDPAEAEQNGNGHARNGRRAAEGAPGSGSHTAGRSVSELLAANGGTGSTPRRRRRAED
ncbi:DUF6779 domain-containing protein [Amycolatopsis nalaikhensis]|uniref:DUF6779 domain-containing protein n=1 Tax=Amycolatopsis nalaikhensis TaxID=715472 RepID=A0ABY8XX66_9PSEU|nr:DUF6779 domain-containing protein [Amycolatopsis sp. 2-2]WIV60197.1 hypothetical protein QP939_17085 [Amycolatopsis sp. 2-2]